MDRDIFCKKTNPVTKLYLDRDVDFDHEPTHEEEEKERKLVMEKLKMVSRTVHALCNHSPDLSLTYIVMATRHGYNTDKNMWKLSFRPFIVRLAIDDYTKIPTLLKHIGQDDFWDMSLMWWRRF